MKLKKSKKMINNILIYLFQSALCLGILYLVYYFLLRKDTLFALNRIYLITIAIFSVIVPLLNIPLSGSTITGSYVVRLEEIQVSWGSDAGIVQRLDFFSVLLAIYLVGVAVLVIRMLVSIIRIILMARKNEMVESNGAKVIVSDQNISIFSFMNLVFVNRQLFQRSELQPILIHEQTHIKQFHTLDLFIAEFLIIVQWFNPAAWILRRSIHENHEFLADQEVLESGYNLRSYQIKIIEELFDVQHIPVTHSFNKSITSKRLIMMKKTKSPVWAKYKVLLALPLAAILFLIFACSQNETDLLAGDDPEKTEESIVYLKPDVMAEFPGGNMEMRKYIASNLKYPKECAENGVQGKFWIKFVVDEKGKVEQFVHENDEGIPPPPEKVSDYEKSGGDPPPPPPPPPPSDEVIKASGVVVVAFKSPENTKTNYDPRHIALLEEEALRVILSMPDFSPAMKDGKPVKAVFTLPINFVLQ
jgi:hypothetical protein